MNEFLMFIFGLVIGWLIGANYKFKKVRVVVKDLYGNEVKRYSYWKIVRRR